MVYRIECEAGNRLCEDLLELKAYIKTLDRKYPYTVERIYRGKNGNHLHLGREWAVKYDPKTGLEYNHDTRVPLQKGLERLTKIYKKK